LTKNCEQNFLGGGKARVSCLFRQSNRNSKGAEKKNSGGEERLMILEFRGHGG